MKLKPILAALAVAVSTFAQPALAGFQFTQNEKGEVTHYNGIPLPPIPTVEEAKAQAQKEIAAAKKAQEAEQAAAASSSNLQSEIGNQQFFFTGKPYLEETGQYLFLFRHYDPELARWTTADPSGFPDGANNVAYMAVPTAEFDWQGLKTVTIAQIVSQSWTNELNWLSAGAGTAGTVIGILTAPSGWGAAVGLTGAGVLVAELADWRDNGRLITDIPGEVPDPYRLKSITKTNQSYRFDTSPISLTVVAITLTWTATYDWNWSE